VDVDDDCASLWTVGISLISETFHLSNVFFSLCATWTVWISTWMWYNRSLLKKLLCTLVFFLFAYLARWHHFVCLLPHVVFCFPGLVWLYPSCNAGQFPLTRSCYRVSNYHIVFCH
jgi:hypothetical protein